MLWPQPSPIILFIMWILKNRYFTEVVNYNIDTNHFFINKTFEILFMQIVPYAI